MPNHIVVAGEDLSSGGPLALDAQGAVADVPAGDTDGDVDHYLTALEIAKCGRVVSNFLLCEREDFVRRRAIAD